MGLLGKLKEKIKESNEERRERKRIYKEAYKKAERSQIKVKAKRDARERYSRRGGSGMGIGSLGIGFDPSGKGGLFRQGPMQAQGPSSKKKKKKKSGYATIRLKDE